MGIMRYTTLLFLVLLIAACNSNPNSIRVQNIKILYSQDETLESVLHKEGWKPITAPFKIKLPYATGRGFSYAWLKGYFYIEGNPKRYYGISLKKFNCTDTVYINTKLVGNSTIKRPIDVLLPSTYIIPGGTLFQKKNEVYIRIGLWGNMPGGIKTSALFIQPRADFDDTIFWNDILYKQIIFGILILYSGLLLFVIIQYSISREKIYRLYAFGALISSIIFLSIFINHETIGLEFLWNVSFALTPVALIFFLFFIQYMYRLYLSNHNKVAVSILAILSVAILFATMLPVIFDLLQVILLFISILFGYSFLAYILYKLHSIKPNRSILYFNIGVITTPLLFLVLTIITTILGIDWPDTVNVYIQPFFMIPFFIYVALESKRRKLKLQQLYSTLKESKSSQKSARLTITDSSEEKLARVIEFINENYASDISREGLAAAVDINPNYLSSLFKAYTGKKINEYINHLRIHEAAKKLKNNEPKIIEIAFDVGFESLSTFIRAFKNELGMTPTEYRKSE